MILSFADELTEEVYHGIYTHAVRKRIPSAVLKSAERKLDILNTVHDLEALKILPSNQPDAPVKDAHSSYSMPISGNWRLAFKWTHKGAESVQLRS